jgi:hypothetical protein
MMLVDCCYTWYRCIRICLLGLNVNELIAEVQQRGLAAAMYFKDKFSASNRLRHVASTQAYIHIISPCGR